ncbi:MAG: hypothetical protein H7282_03955 [Cytophagaceae bacterium]|nr:hypothetical protein [Cytophagaceae bacterium]
MIFNIIGKKLSITPGQRRTNLKVVLIHQIGLQHTHNANQNGTDTNEECGDCYQESVSRIRTQSVACVSTIGKNKCEVNGDFLCDTDADPKLNRSGMLRGSNGYTYTGTRNRQMGSILDAECIQHHVLFRLLPLFLHAYASS